ncbi:FtsH protease activity modulator HflK [Acidobacteria bacterium AH-259-D05]|nr:FtsH protease activity modulator HflK [Acidobacteria bacterium AH-259-D05]
MDKDVIDISKIQLPDISPRIIVMGAAALLGLLILLDTFYQIQPEEVGVIRRFGAYVRTTQPGLRFKLPMVETVVKVPVQRQLKQEFGFRTMEPGVRTVYSRQDFLGESLMLTGDLNVAVVEWIVQYRVADPYLYLFRVRNVEDTFRDMTEAVIREVVGDRTVTEVLTVGRQDIESTVQAKLQELCRDYETGITVDQVVLQDVNPPDPVKPSWDQVNQAQQQRDRLINEAQGEYNKIIPRAQGEAEQTILQAEGYALDRVNRSQGDASRFNALQEAYRRSPQVTRRRMYLETMAKVLPRMGGKLFIDQDAGGVMPLLPLETLRGLTGTGENQGGER